MKLNLQDINLNALLHFHVIAKHRSLSQAAKELHLSAPAVTHSLNNLEGVLGGALCIRTRATFQLTQDGTKLFQLTQTIFKELEAFTTSYEDETQFDGTLNIGVLDHFENLRLQAALEKVVKAFPLLKLNIQSYDSETINKLLLEGEIELGFGVFSQRSPRLKYAKIGEENLRYYISNKHPLWKKKKVQKEDLFGQKTTWLDNQNRKRSDLENNIFVENLKYKMKFFAFSNNLSGALQILLSGHAIVPLPENYGATLEKLHPVKKIEVETKNRILDQIIVYHPSMTSSVAVKMLIGECLGA